MTKFKPQTPRPASPVRRLAVDQTTAAHMLGIGRTTWFSLLADGKGPPVVRVGSRRLVRVAAIEEWL